MKNKPSFISYYIDSEPEASLTFSALLLWLLVTITYYFLASSGIIDAIIGGLCISIVLIILGGMIFGAYCFATLAYENVMWRYRQWKNIDLDE